MSPGVQLSVDSFQFAPSSLNAYHAHASPVTNATPLENSRPNHPHLHRTARPKLLHQSSNRTSPTHNTRSQYPRHCCLQACSFTRCHSVYSPFFSRVFQPGGYVLPSHCTVLSHVSFLSTWSDCVSLLWCAAATQYTLNSRCAE